ncbi:MAG: A/G-specific adenine glycosylase [Paludibacter sp.]|nr:A/G-specific adenine glycosylase [Paludibacter sp.]
MHNKNQISALLVRWYHKNKRDLPWRDTQDPYKIWISEIILQQTRVNQGLDYYNRFIARFPDVTTLAMASEDEVLKYWQGLGYYSRARNLHKAAKQIVSSHQGKFPDNYHDIISLSGVGAYTAAAICSFAYNLPFAAVDGNVYRVLSRIFGIDTPIDSPAGIKTFQQIAQEILDKNNPGIHNQAIMEFGALQCVPASPNCELCLLNNICISFASNLINFLPVKTKKTKTRKRHFNYLFIKNKNYTYLQKRTGDDVWKNLYEFPLIEEDRVLEVNELFQHEDFKKITKDIVSEITIKPLSLPVKHMLTHQQIFAQFFMIEIKEKNEFISQLEETEITAIDKYPVSRLMDLFIKNHLG